jgi:hypothetical protein
MLYQMKKKTGKIPRHAGRCRQMRFDEKLLYGDEEDSDEEESGDDDDEWN